MRGFRLYSSIRSSFSEDNCPKVCFDFRLPSLWILHWLIDSIGTKVQVLVLSNDQTQSKYCCWFQDPERKDIYCDDPTIKSRLCPNTCNAWEEDVAAEDYIMILPSNDLKTFRNPEVTKNTSSSNMQSSKRLASDGVGRCLAIALSLSLSLSHTMNDTYMQGRDDAELPFLILFWIVYERETLDAIVFASSIVNHYLQVNWVDDHTYAS